MTTIVLKNHDWDSIRRRIDADYGNITIMLSWRCKETLGFTIRRPRGFNPLNGHFEDDTRLDFVSEEAATFFRLKYYVA
jgi:hypothetical protein